MSHSTVYVALRFTKELALFVGVVAGLLSSAVADQIVMKDGDRLSGTILKSDGKTLILKTTYAGEINVQWNEIQGMT